MISFNEAVEILDKYVHSPESGVDARHVVKVCEYGRDKGDAWSPSIEYDYPFGTDPGFLAQFQIDKRDGTITPVWSGDPSGKPVGDFPVE